MVPKTDDQAKASYPKKRTKEMMIKIKENSWIKSEWTMQITKIKWHNLVSLRIFRTRRAMSENNLVKLCLEQGCKIIVNHDTRSAQISQRQEGCNIYAIMKTVYSPDYYHNGFVATHVLGHIMYGFLFVYSIVWR